MISWQNQFKFSVTADGVELDQKKTIMFSDMDQVKKAELLQALHVVEINISFALPKSDNERVRLIL